MSFLDSIILGIVEGITEFLPISSTGHLILTSHILNLSQTEFLKSFEITIQMGAILAVVALYWRKLFLNKKIFLLVSTAFIPTAIIGFGLYKIIKGFLLSNNLVVLWALAIGGVILILFERWQKYRINRFKYSMRNSLGVHMPKFALDKKEEIRRIEDMGYWRAMGIGVFQALAVVPGVSRSAATIVGGMLLRVSRITIVEFSFILAVPTMIAATGYDLFKSGFSFSGREFLVLVVGFVVAFLVAIFSIKWLMGYIKNHTFTSFGFYRIVLAIIFALFLL